MKPLPTYDFVEHLGQQQGITRCELDALPRPDDGRKVRSGEAHENLHLAHNAFLQPVALRAAATRRAFVRCCSTVFSLMRMRAAISFCERSSCH